MIISLITYYTLAAIIAIVIVGTLLYLRNGVPKEKQSKYEWPIPVSLFLLVILHYNLFASVITVTACNEYKEEKLLFPTKEFGYGQKTHIINESDEDLLVEYVTYGTGKIDEKDTLIRPKGSYTALRSSITYMFRDAPPSIRQKGSGAVKVKLTCFDSSMFNFEEFEEDLDDEKSENLEASEE